MQFDYNNLADAIYYILENNPNQQISAKEIDDIIYRSKICPSYCFGSHKNSYEYFKECLHKVSTFKNIIYDGEKYYEYVKRKHYDIKKIEEIINNIQNYPNIKFDDFYENGHQTIMHILCIEKRLDLLKKICNMYDVDIFVENAKGEYIWNVVRFNPANIQDMKLFESFVNFVFNQIDKKQLHELKIANGKLLEVNRQLTKQVRNITIFGIIIFIARCTIYYSLLNLLSIKV